MEWSEGHSKHQPPTYDEVSTFIRNECWSEFNLRISQRYGVSPTFEYSCCTMQPGWNVKYKKKGKNLCTLYPMSGYFKLLIVINVKQHEAVEAILQTLDDQIQQCYINTAFSNGAKWLMIDVKTSNVLRDCLKLISCKQLR